MDAAVDAANADTPAPGGPLLQVVAVLLSPVPDGSRSAPNEPAAAAQPTAATRLAPAPAPRHTCRTLADPLIFTFLLVPPIVRRVSTSFLPLPQVPSTNSCSPWAFSEREL